MSMRILLAATLALAACSTSDASPSDAGPPDAAVPAVATLQGWTVSAGAPVLASGQITGSVTFVRTSGADTRGGGLCLVADLNSAKACTSEADCAGVTIPAGGSVYCGGDNGAPSKICWTRPGPDTIYCTKAPNRTPGTYMTPAAPAVVDGKATRWLGLGCMGIETNPMGCASDDPAMSVHVFGPSVTATP